MSWRTLLGVALLLAAIVSGWSAWRMRDLGKFWLRIELASRGPSPAPVICSLHAVFSPVPASRIAAVTARSPAATSAAIIATMSGSMSSFSFTRASDPLSKRAARGRGRARPG